MSLIIVLEIIFKFYLSQTHVELNNYVFLRSPQYFKDPDKFLPERWLRDGDTSAKNIHPYVLLPFGHGPRMCAGNVVSHIKIENCTFKHI